MYESKITTKRWIVLAVIGNAGWIMFYAALIHIFAAHQSLLENKMAAAMITVDIACAVEIFMALVELILERIQKLNFVLPRKRLYRGFGTLMVAGLVAAIATLVARLSVFNADCLSYALVGCLLCGISSRALFREYKLRK